MEPQDLTDDELREFAEEFLLRKSREILQEGLQAEGKKIPWDRENEYPIVREYVGMIDKNIAGLAGRPKEGHEVKVYNHTRGGVSAAYVNEHGCFYVSVLQDDEDDEISFECKGLASVMLIDELNQKHPIAQAGRFRPTFNIGRDVNALPRKTSNREAQP